MGWLAVVQQAMNDRAAAGLDGGVVPAADSVAPVADGGDDQQWPPPPPGFLPQVHGQARQAEAVRNQIPIIHCLATPAAAATAAMAIRPGNPAPVPPAAAATTAPARVANPFTFTSPNYRQPIPQVPAQQQGFSRTHQQAYQQQQQYPGPSYGPGQGFGYQPNAPYGTAQFSAPYGGMWNQQ
jgi:hypothetical protein